jgi:hypothetical protein
MAHSTVTALLAGVGIAAMAVFAGGVSAAPPTQADIDLCNQKAAEAARTANSGQTAMSQQPGAPGNNPTGGRITDSTQPGTEPGSGGTQPGREVNPTGGRITDSTQPGSAPSMMGMAPMGQTNSAYRQAYVVCMSQRGR